MLERQEQKRQQEKAEVTKWNKWVDEEVNKLQSEGAKLKIYDPCAMEKARRFLKDVRFCKDPYEVCRGSDCLLIVSEWDEFKELDFNRIKRLLKRPLIFDGRNIYDPQKLAKLGFRYVGIGRKGFKK